MSRKPSREELERKVQGLEPYREAYACLRRGEEELTFRSEERSVTVLGLARASGGVVVRVDGIDCVEFFESFRMRLAQSGYYDLYLKEICGKITRAQTEAIQARMSQPRETLARKECETSCAADHEGKAECWAIGCTKAPLDGAKGCSPQHEHGD